LVSTPFLLSFDSLTRLIGIFDFRSLRWLPLPLSVKLDLQWPIIVALCFCRCRKQVEAHL
jgi:hypothetical protein